jgi:hypothetical protein
MIRFSHTFFFLLLFALMAGSQSFAQGEARLLLFMHDIPQSSLENPAIIPSQKAHFSVMLSGVQVSAGHSGFAWSDLIRQRADDSLYVDAENALQRLRDSNLVHSDLQLELISLGIRLNQEYFSFYSRLRTNVFMQYDRYLPELLVHGNAAYIGEEIRLNRMVLTGYAWLEHSLGYARSINDKLQAGLRLKYLNGLAGSHLAKSHFSLKTAEHTHDLTLESSFLMHTSLPEEFNSSITGNHGFGLDFGLLWQPIPGLNISAGIKDMGRIWWKKNLMSYQIDEKSSFTFTGLELENLFGENGDLDDKLQSLSDSLDMVFSPKEQETAFHTGLPAILHAGATWQAAQNTSAGVWFSAQAIDGNYYPAISLSLHQKVGNVLSLATAVAYDHYGISPGMGLTLNAGFLQLYLISSNVPAFFTPQHARYAGLRFGFNFMIRDGSANNLPDQE